MSNDPKADARKIIVDGDVNALVDAAASTGSALARQLTTSQIRNVFGEVRRIQMRWRSTDPTGEDTGSFRNIVLIQPKLAYQARRERGQGVEQLRQVLDPCLDELRKAPKNERYKYFERFADFFEAILAYHKAAGGN